MNAIDIFYAFKKHSKGTLIVFLFNKTVTYYNNKKIDD